MYATVSTTVLPEFTVDVYAAYEDQPLARQRYVLVLRDDTAGALELVFPSAQDLRYFLATVRDALASARHEAQARKARLRQPKLPAGQATLF